MLKGRTLMNLIELRSQGHSYHKIIMYFLILVSIGKSKNGFWTGAREEIRTPDMLITSEVYIRSEETLNYKNACHRRCPNYIWTTKNAIVYKNYVLIYVVLIFTGIIKALFTLDRELPRSSWTH
ncbi:hypothetical protein AXFE_01790 [Acidithrix ferrooxidans]|uniref:Uncharacterized protein n=1 Tax=Acidithrix ferrooxidans TaxID=1280514 RepID=A0A0D8HLV9_9ACTN|nr:hypothetical protein AXFE_01790 [Acidithrix ferrooxidans]